MANFLYRENPDGLSPDSMPVTRPGASAFPPPGDIDPAYQVRAHWDDIRSRRSIRRMKILTAISATVTLALVAQRYAPDILNHSRQDQTSATSTVSRRAETVPSVPVQNASQIPATLTLKPEKLLTATKEEVMSAIQEPIRDTDLPRTSGRAKAGDSAAQYNMGLRFADGDGVPQNYAEAMTWFTNASEGGNSEAQVKLVFGYIGGIGVPRDENQAVMWLKRAANSGDTWAQRALSHLYLIGQNVPRDYVRAYTWAKIASESEGHDNDELRTLGSQMSEAQITNAERRISNWNHARQNFTATRGTRSEP